MLPPCFDLLKHDISYQGLIVIFELKKIQIDKSKHKNNLVKSGILHLGHICRNCKRVEVLSDPMNYKMNMKR